jgi:hypothetical protein
MKTLLATLAVAFALCSSVRAEDTYDLKLKYVPKPGDRTNHKSTETMQMKMSILMGGEVVREQDGTEKKSFEYTEEVLKVDGDDMVEGKFTFREATRDVEGVDTAFAFKGKTVIGKKGDDGWNFTYEDGSEVEEDDVEGLRDGLDKKRKKAGQPDIQDVLAPGKPVKVGESWDIDVKVFAKTIMEDEESFDAEKSKGSLTLVSVDRRDGATWGKLEGTLELAAKSLGPLVLDKTLKFKFKMNFDVCIDGTTPAGTLGMEAKMKGKRGAEANGQAMDVDMDMKMEGTKVVERAK